MTGTPFKCVSVFTLVHERITRRLLVGSGITYNSRVSWFRFTHRKYDGSTSTVTSRSIRVDSTTSPTHLRSYAEYSLSVLQIDLRYDGSTSAATSRTIWQNLQPPFGIFSKCLANRLLVWRVDFNLDESFNSTTFSTTLDSYLWNIS